MAHAGMGRFVDTAALSLASAFCCCRLSSAILLRASFSSAESASHSACRATRAAALASLCAAFFSAFFLAQLSSSARLRAAFFSALLVQPARRACRAAPSSSGSLPGSAFSSACSAAPSAPSVASLDSSATRWDARSDSSGRRDPIAPQATHAGFPDLIVCCGTVAISATEPLTPRWGCATEPLPLDGCVRGWCIARPAYMYMCLCG
eukprot:scaffold303767_cov43-Tisochrysis_lutea.AAC.2